MHLANSGVLNVRDTAVLTVSAFSFQHLPELASSAAMYSVFGSATPRVAGRLAEFSDVAETFRHRLCLSVTRESAAHNPGRKQFKYHSHQRTNTTSGTNAENGIVVSEGQRKGRSYALSQDKPFIPK